MLRNFLDASDDNLYGASSRHMIVKQRMRCTIESQLFDRNVRSEAQVLPKEEIMPNYAFPLIGCKVRSSLLSVWKGGRVNVPKRTSEEDSEAN